MAIFAYKGINSSGKNVKGVEDADSAKMLRMVLKRKGILVTELLEKAEAEKKNAREIDIRKLLRRVKTIDISVATQQLATLVKAGIPLVEALTALIEQTEQPELKAAFTTARDKVNEGTNFADALREHPKYFSNLYVNMVAAGEASGTLETVLDRLAGFLDAQVRLEGKVRGALAYPIVMLILSLLIITLMMVVVVPKVKNIFEGFGEGLPWYTEVLIFVSDVFTDYWYILATLLGLSIYGFRRWKASEEGAAKWDRFILRIPLVGKLLLMVAVSRFSRTLGTLLKSGVPIMNAMTITKNVLENRELMEVIDTAKESVAQGDGFSRPLKASGKFPPMVVHMIAIGERTGQLEEMLENVADAYDQQVEVKVEAMSAVMEPLIIVFMGGIVGAIAAAILMPLLQINDFVG
ncbi:MAG: type II secretion system inner membrane protein GspF [Polyangiales bacterium]